MKPSRRLTGLRILVVEDEITVSLGVEAMLGRLACIVVGPAARADQALAVIATETIDAAVLDLDLDGGMGGPVARALAGRGVPVVFSTGRDRRSLPDISSRGTVLRKPFTRSALRDALATLLNRGEHGEPGAQTSPVIWDAKRLRIAVDAAGVALCAWNAKTNSILMDERAHGLWGIPAGPVTFEDLSARIHPEDLDNVRAAFGSTRAFTEFYEIDFRILHGTRVRWVSARGRGSDQGAAGHLMIGVFLDVTERKMAEEAREMIAGEMGHRVKNLFSIASALTVLAERSSTTTTAMSRDLKQRFAALNRAHDLVRPVPGDPKRAASLRELLAVLMAPYVGEGSGGDRVRIAVPQIGVGESSVTTLALVMHELATNSLKYGALSAAAGTVDVTATLDDDDVVIDWCETGGPLVSSLDRRAGFGSQMVMNAVSGQLGGSIVFQWRPQGVVVLTASRTRLGG